MDTKLLSMKDTTAIERCNVPAAELSGEWWKALGRATEPQDGKSLRELADEVLLDGEVKVGMAARSGRAGDAEAAFTHAIGLAKALLRRASAAEAKANRPAFVMQSVEYGPDGLPILYDRHAHRDYSPPPGEAKSYRHLFGKSRQSLDTGGFGSFGEFMQVVASGRWDPRLEVKQHLAGVGTLGGYAVPEAWASFLFDAVVGASAVLPRARLVPMEALQVHVPAWDDLDQSTGTVYGGFSGQWLGEGATATEQTAKLRQLTLTAHKLVIYTSASRELLLGAVTTGFEAELRTALTQAIAAKLDEAFLTGDGVGKPEGILHSPALRLVNRETANMVKYDDLAKVLAALHPSFVSRATWLMNPRVLSQLILMKDTQNRPLWIEGMGAPPATLFGRPIVWSDRLPTLGQKGDVVLLADGSYVVGMLRDVAIDVSNAPAWSRDLMSFRAVLLGDGAVSWNKPYKAPDNQTYSVAVALTVPA